MPPKKNDKKAQQAKQAKVVEDKTFGLKNKNKSAKVQKYVEEVKKQASNATQQKRGGPPEPAGPTKKEREAQRKAELAELFKPVQTQKVPFGTDPKTVLCAFFKSGLCQKGAKCKFSHDPNVERKSAKIDVYSDKRDQDKEADSMDTWDQNKLESVIKSKHGNPRTTTDIVCKHFLEAIENAKYGWFWVCPAGGDQCKYRHALPPGYVLKKKADKKAGDDDVIPLEEFLETERHQLGTNLTPITLETFTAWKARRLEAAAQAEADATKAKADALKAGRKQGLSGRDLFTLQAPEDMDDGGADGGDADDNDFDLSRYLRDRAESDAAAEAEAQRQSESARAAAGERGGEQDEPPAASLEQLALEDVAEDEQ
ncbi:Translation machinery-associated protein 46 [Blastocladiella emersonii ATCC 22665]|nr:Translation machinery-associated protein 46 [Blastocladiella emersonii ATCC 22665]